MPNGDKPVPIQLDSDYFGSETTAPESDLEDVERLRKEEEARKIAAAAEAEKAAEDKRAREEQRQRVLSEETKKIGAEKAAKQARAEAQAAAEREKQRALTEQAEEYGRAVEAGDKYEPPGERSETFAEDVQFANDEENYHGYFYLQDGDNRTGFWFSRPADGSSGWEFNPALIQMTDSEAASTRTMHDVHLWKDSADKTEGFSFVEYKYIDGRWRRRWPNEVNDKGEPEFLDLEATKTVLRRQTGKTKAGQTVPLFTEGDIVKLTADLELLKGHDENRKPKAKDAPITDTGDFLRELDVALNPTEGELTGEDEQKIVDRFVKGGQLDPTYELGDIYREVYGKEGAQSYGAYLSSGLETLQGLNPKTQEELFGFTYIDYVRDLESLAVAIARRRHLDNMKQSTVKVRVASLYPVALVGASQRSVPVGGFTPPASGEVPDGVDFDFWHGIQPQAEDLSADRLMGAAGAIAMMTPAGRGAGGFRKLWSQPWTKTKGSRSKIVRTFAGDSKLILVPGKAGHVTLLGAAGQQAGAAASRTATAPFEPGEEETGYSISEAWRESFGKAVDPFELRTTKITDDAWWGKTTSSNSIVGEEQNQIAYWFRLVLAGQVDPVGSDGTVYEDYPGGFGFFVDEMHKAWGGERGDTVESASFTEIAGSIEHGRIPYHRASDAMRSRGHSLYSERPVRLSSDEVRSLLDGNILGWAFSGDVTGLVPGFVREQAWKNQVDTADAAIESRIKRVDVHHQKLVEHESAKQFPEAVTARLKIGTSVNSVMRDAMKQQLEQRVRASPADNYDDQVKALYAHIEQEKTYKKDRERQQSLMKEMELDADQRQADRPEHVVEQELRAVEARIADAEKLIDFLVSGDQKMLRPFVDPKHPRFLMTDPKTGETIEGVYDINKFLDYVAAQKVRVLLQRAQLRAAVEADEEGAKDLMERNVKLKSDKYKELNPVGFEKETELQTMFVEMQKFLSPQLQSELYKPGIAKGGGLFGFVGPIWPESKLGPEWATLWEPALKEIVGAGLHEAEKNSLLALLQHYVTNPQEEWTTPWYEAELPNPYTAMQGEPVPYAVQKSVDWEHRLPPGVFETVDEMFKDAQRLHEVRRRSWSTRKLQEYESYTDRYDRMSGAAASRASTDRRKAEIERLDKVYARYGG